MNGWLKIHRKMMDWEWYNVPNTFTLFMHLLIEANREPKDWHNIHIGTGQLVTSINSLCKSTGLSFQEVRTALRNIQSTNEITIKATNKYSLITINKYVDYQLPFLESQQAEEQTREQSTNNNIRNKEERIKENNKRKGHGNNGTDRRGTEVPRTPDYTKGF